MNANIKVAVIGAGEIAEKARIPAYLANESVNLAALVDLDTKRASRVAKRLGIGKCFASVEELFDEETVDAVSICTPPHTHADLAIKALNHGAHVLCEKPMAEDIQRGKEMLAVSRTRAKILMVSSYRRFVSVYHTARKRMKEGALGRVYCIEDIQLSSSPLLTWGKSPWYYDTKGGGVLFDLGPHCFDLINYLYEDYPLAISARGSKLLDSPVEECCVCILEYPESRLGLGTMSWLSSSSVENTSIHGTAESMYVSPTLTFEINRTDIPEISLWREVTIRLINMKFPNFPVFRVPQNPDPMQLETDYFVEQVKSNQTFSKTALNAYGVLATIDAAKRSMQENKRVEIALVK